MQCSIIKQYGFVVLGLLLLVTSFFSVFASSPNVVSATATSAVDTNNDGDGALSPSSSSSLPKSTLRNLVNMKLYGRPAISKWLTARSDCTVQVISYLQDPDAELIAEEEEFVCELDAVDAPGGYTGLTRKLRLTDEQRSKFKSMWIDGKLTPGKSKFKISGMAQGLLFNSQEIQVPPGLDVTNPINWSSDRFTDLLDSNSVFVEEGDDRDDLIGDRQPSSSSPYSDKYGLFNRNLQSVSFGTHIGPTPILVVKVIDKNGLARPETTAVISDDVFGTSGDTVTLKSQLYACSMGRLTVIPGDNNSGKINQSVYDAAGVVAVKLTISIETSTKGDIRNAVTAAVQQELGVTLPGPYKHVMYVLQKCYNDCGWAAYAFVNGWNTVFVGEYYKFVGVQVHEIGHNFGLSHSGGLDGGEYSDHTCMMGNPLYADDVGKMCYNGAKNWQIGWYNDRKLMLNPKSLAANNPSWSALITLVGVADYQNEANIPVVLKLETDTVNDYFVAFNRATGINADNKEADNEVTVVLAGKNGDSSSQSYLNATLFVGDQYAIAEFGGGARTCVIKFVSIDKSTSVWKAYIQLTTSGALLPSFSPTSSKPTTTAKPYSMTPSTVIPKSLMPTTLNPTSPKPTITTSKTFNPTNTLNPTLPPPSTTVTPTRSPTRSPTIKPTVLLPTDKPTPTA